MWRDIKLYMDCKKLRRLFTAMVDTYFESKLAAKMILIARGHR